MRQLAGLEADSATATQQKPSRPGVPVIVSPVREIRDLLTYETVGTGVASRSVMLRSEVEGIVKSSRLASGKHFREGEVILTLEDRNEQLALQLAKTKLDQAQRDSERLEGLRKRGIVSETVYRDAVTEAQLAKLEFEQALLDVEDRALRAPFDGVSGLPEVEPGDRIESGTNLASFDDRRALMVEFDLPEALISRLQTGDIVKATTASVPDVTFDGSVVSVDSRIDPEKRTARVRVEIPNQEDRLRPGASFKITIDLKGSIYPAVPELALQFASGSLYVWRISEDVSQKVEVTMVRRRAGNVLVNGPISEGDSVAIEGMQRLSPGRSVQVISKQQTGE